jgi:hypothetical protein
VKNIKLILTILIRARLHGTHEKGVSRAIDCCKEDFEDSLKDRVLQVMSNPYEVDNDVRASIGGTTPGTTTRDSLFHSPDCRH